VYILEIDKTTDEIVVKTKNKKYYKRVKIPDMARKKLTLTEKDLLWEYKNNTLIVSVYILPVFKARMHNSGRGAEEGPAYERDKGRQNRRRESGLQPTIAYLNST